MSSDVTPLALTPADAARTLAISPRSLSRLVAAGKIKARRTAGRLLIDYASLRHYYEALPEGPHDPVRMAR